MSLRTPKGKAIAVLLGVLGLLIGGAILARYASAETGPAIVLTVRDSSGATVTTAPIGSVVSANALVATSSASTTPSTVNFNLYANTSCSGTPTTQSGVALVGSAATSSTTTVSATGLSYQVHFNGDAQNAPSDSACVVVLPTSAHSAITGSLSASSVLAGSTVFERSTLSSVTQSASGTVAYTVYTDGACTQGARSAGSVNVSNAAVPNSNSLSFMLAGTYYWQAVYSGDAQDSAATSSCTQLSVLATSTPSVPTATSTPSHHHDDQDDEAGEGHAPGIGLHFIGQLTSALTKLDSAIAKLQSIRDSIASSSITASTTLMVHDRGLHLGELKHAHELQAHQKTDRDSD